MMTRDYAAPDWRGLCEELAGWIERSTRHYIQDPDVLIRAYAALDQPEPEVPVPAAVGEAAHIRRMCDIILGNTFGNEELDSLALLVGHHPDVLNASPPPVEGEVAELVALIRQIALAWEPDACLLGNMTAGQLARAANLLEQRHPTPVPVAEAEVADGPTRDELWELWLRLNNELPDRPAAVAEFWEHAQIDALARWGRPALAPAGELLKEAAWLRNECSAENADGNWISMSIDQALDLASLLERQAAPVPVAERLPGPGDCDEEGFCWWFSPSDPSAGTFGVAACWVLRKYEPEDDFRSHWLPAHALPLPQGEVQP